MKILNQLWMPVCLSLFLVTDYLYTQCDRQIMVDDYETYIKSTQMSTDDLGWTGDEMTCQAGDWSSKAKEACFERINYFRRLAGVSTVVTMDEDLSVMCQEASVMMHRNNKLSHDPDKNWDCYSDDGHQAAGKSNLALGVHSVHALSLYMKDPGTNNTAVGHRRWILYSRAKDFGMGSTDRAHTLYVVHNKQPAPADLVYIAYPNKGFFPAPLVPDRWSFSVPGAKYDEINIKMTGPDGLDIPVNILPIKEGYADNTVVWEPAPEMIEKFSEFDMQYQVTIKNVKKGGTSTDYAYTVNIAPTIFPPNCPNGQVWNPDNCGCKTQQTTPTVDQTIRQIDFSISPNPGDRYIQVRWPENNQLDHLDHMYTILNSAGQQVRTNKVQEGIISTFDLPDGLYFLSVFNQKYHGVKSFLIRH